ncbi:MAG: bifunctional riboflavin kinase/FAD synthetase [Dehalococcoidia bacterium]
MSLAALQEIQSLNVPRGTILTIGTFDGVHRGHQAIISAVVNRAKKEGLLSGCITFKDSPRQTLRPGTPFYYLMALQERIDVLAGLGLDVVLPLTFDTDLASVEAERFIGYLVDNLNLKHLIVGPDFALGYKRKGTIEVIKKIGQDRGFTVESISSTNISDGRVSSTRLRELLSEIGDVASANELLGRPYSIESVVKKGHQRGQTIGYRTANLDVPSNRIIPLDGVYVTSTTLGENIYRSVTNIGDNPTFGDKMTSVETYILDFDQMIYDETIKVEFLHRVRGEIKFESVDKLTEQIAADVEITREYFSKH